MASRVMGFIRDMLMASYFGATVMSDAFFVAFRIPNLLRRFIAEGTLTVAFIPIYTDVLMKKGEDEALRLAQKVFTMQMAAILALTAAGIIFSPQIVEIMGYGFTDRNIIGITVDINRIMFPYLFFVGLVAFSMGILNSHGYFFAPAFSTVLFNLGIIIGIVFFSRFFDQPLYGVSIGVLLGGFLQFILQIPYMIKAGFRVKISFDFRNPSIRRIMRLFVLAFYANGIIQINILISTIFATSLPAGSLSYIYYSDRLVELVLGIFIISISSVILPEMSKLSSSEDHGKMKELYTSSIRSALFLAIPACVALMALGLPIISVLFVRNKFTMDDAVMTQSALFFAAAGIPSVSILRITTPAFFSLEDVRKPVISATVGLAVFLISGYTLMHTGLKHAGLTLANSLSVTVQMALLLFWLQKKIGRISPEKIIPALAKYLFSSLVMGGAVYWLSVMVPWDSGGLILKAGSLMAIILSGSIIYFGLCYFLKVEEFTYLKRKMRERLAKRRIR